MFVCTRPINVPAFVSPIPSAWRSMAIGIPTFLDRPQTTAFLPNVSIPAETTPRLE